MSHEIPGTIRLSEQAKDQLIKLKRLTGIKQWNVLCRWALCTSLADPTPPLVRTVRADSNVEMSWKTFSGSCDVAFQALLKSRMHLAGENFDSVSELTAAHIHRGVGMLAGSDTGLVPLLSNAASSVARTKSGSRARGRSSLRAPLDAS